MLLTTKAHFQKFQILEMSGKKLSLKKFAKNKSSSNTFEIPKDDIDQQRLAAFSKSLSEILQHTDSILSKYPEQAPILVPNSPIK